MFQGCSPGCGLVTFDNKSTTDGKIGALQKHLLALECGDLNTVCVARKHGQGAQGYIEFSVVQNRSVNFALLAAGSRRTVHTGRIPGERQSAVHAIALDHGVCLGEADSFGHMPAQPFERRAHGAVPCPGCGE